MAYALLWMGVVLFYIFVVVCMKRMMRESKEALGATEAMCDAADEFRNWLDDPFSNHSEAEFRERIRKIIRAEKRFADTHPGADMESSIVRWNEIIDQNT